MEKGGWMSLGTTHNLEQMQEMQRRIEEMQHVVFPQGSHNVEMPTASPPNCVSCSHVLYRMMTMRKPEACSSRSVYHLAIMLHPHIYHLEAMQPLQASVKPLSQEDLVGRDIILYHLVRSDPVAKAMVISTNQNTIVGGEVLGLQYYEVLVNIVLKREVELARGYDGMQTMGI